MHVCGKMHTLAHLWKQKRVSYPFEPNLSDSGAHRFPQVLLRSLYPDSLLPVSLWDGLTFFSHQLNLEAILRTVSASFPEFLLTRPGGNGAALFVLAESLSLFSCHSLVNDWVCIFSPSPTMKYKSPRMSIHICFVYCRCGKKKEQSGMTARRMALL